MPEPAYMDFEEPSEPAPSARTRKPGKDVEKKSPIPRLPERESPLTGDEIKRGVSDRGRAAANLKVDGFTYQEIADMLEFADARTAKREVERVLAATHSPEDWETLRIIATARAEQQWRRSSAMAAADFLLDEDGTKIPNVDKLRWHQQSGIDLMNHAIITGAKAPTKHEITPGDGVLDSLVDRLLQAGGYEEIIEAEVIELEYLPPSPPPEDDADHT